MLELAFSWKEKDTCIVQAVKLLGAEQQQQSPAVTEKGIYQHMKYRLEIVSRGF